MAIGMLIEEEKLKLDENIYDIFPDHINAFSKIFRRLSWSADSLL